MYKNYLFDLYGTLADIHTDEEQAKLWDTIAEFYTANGAKYSGRELRAAYEKYTEEEKSAAAARHPEYRYIDIKIEKVFKKLYTEKGVNADDSLVIASAAEFRTESREYIRLYEGIAQLLDDLKMSGKNV